MFLPLWLWGGWGKGLWTLEPPLQVEGKVWVWNHLVSGLYLRTASSCGNAAHRAMEVLSCSSVSSSSLFSEEPIPLAEVRALKIRGLRAAVLGWGLGQVGPVPGARDGV